MSRITGLALSEITLAAVSKPSSGLRIIVQIAQLSNSCGARALGHYEPAQRQLQIILVELELEVELKADAFVQTALRTTFADPTAIDTAFADVLRTACIAQGITQSCPNPPSLALRLASRTTPTEAASLDITALAGGLAAGLLVCLCILAGTCLYMIKKKAMASPNARPPPTTTTSSSSASNFVYVNPRIGSRHSAVKSVFTP